MMNLDGEWDCIAKTPMGSQKAVLRLVREGATFSGVSTSANGVAIELLDGRIEGDSISWRMEIPAPAKVMLTGKATISGDTLTGGLKAGPFGVSPLTGVRRA